MHFVMAQPQQLLHQLISFANQLHIAVFDAIVDHLHEMARSVLAHPVTAGSPILHLGANGLEDRLDGFPGGIAAAGHHTGTLQRAFLAAGYTGTYIQKALAFHISGTADGIREMAVAAVDEDITGFQIGDHCVDQLVHRTSCLDHHHDLPGPLQIVRQFLQAVAADDIFTLGTAFRKIVHPGCGPVVHRHREALGLHIHYQVFTHHRKADQADIRFFHIHYLFTLALPS